MASDSHTTTDHEEWLSKFHESGPAFLYQSQKGDGSDCTSFALVRR